MAHVASSVGWLGAVAAFLVLAVTGYTTTDEWTMRAAYTVMEIIGWTALVPFSALTLLTGVLQAIGTPWGLIKHYWVLIKLLITIAATTVLLLYMETLIVLADAVTQSTPGGTVPDLLPNFSPVLHSAAALIVLLVALGLSIYKPRGLTGIGATGFRSARQRR
ncbi:cation transport ATPase [Arthrobacter pigmenti]|uniref:Cation transport ATPase n=1 Tax=Arthrobacter pigmenti TaxID=271432 RepID=A0A846RR89_9MICC|nr:cation transport ATPase [Arthrobacter pigmenti]